MEEKILQKIREEKLKNVKTNLRQRNSTKLFNQIMRKVLNF